MEAIAAAIVAVVVALTAPAAASHKILVLPVEGAIDAATRNRLTADIVRQARSLDGQVASGSATFADTALAVGCDPRAAGCSDEVMATLGVDELVWGAASRDRGQIRLVVRRAARGAAVREVSMTFASGDAGDRIAAGIAPLFAPPAAAPEPAPAPRPAGPPAAPPSAPPPAVAAAQAWPGPAAEPGPPLAAAPGPGDDHRDRKLGIALAAGEPCGNVQCPSGYDCTIRCMNSGACGAVGCAPAHSCDVECSGPASCGNVNCGMNACAIDCSGVLACPRIDCAASCSCDVSCSGASSCPSMACPMGLLGPCTDQGSAGAPCNSNPAGCSVCPQEVT